MTLTVADITFYIEQVAQPKLAEDWDNVGLQVGDPRWPVKNIWIALDPLAEVVEAACQHKADLLITHHPLIFRPLKAVSLTSSVGAIIEKALRHKLAIYAAHTNLDKASGGLNDILAERIGLKHLQALEIKNSEAGHASLMEVHENQPGIGRVGELRRPVSLKSLALTLKKILGSRNVRLAGDSNLQVKRVAICTGSGSAFLKDFLSSGAEAYISGDLRYHDAREVEACGRGLIDIGHFASEYLMVPAMAEQLKNQLLETGFSVNIHACTLEKDPFITF
jgi:dinuclear metal center YbgI/SA1388 family protein